MKTLIEHLAGYGDYHRDRRNLLTHVVGIPMIVLSVTTLLARPVLAFAGPVALTPAVIVYALACLFYLRLSVPFGVTMAAILAVFVLVGDRLAGLPTTLWLTWGIGLFVAGWAIQFVGHYFEGRKPAFVDDVSGLLVGPLYLVAEAAFALGLARRTRAELAAHAD